MFITFTDSKNKTISIDSNNFYLEKYEDKNSGKIFMVKTFLGNDMRVFFVDEECFNDIKHKINCHETMME